MTDGAAHRNSSDPGRRTGGLRKYPLYYPVLTLDYLWRITDQNGPQRWLLEPLQLSARSEEPHFFDLLFAPPFRQWQEAHHDWWSAVMTAARCFEEQTAVFRKQHPAASQYERTIAQLSARLPRFPQVVEQLRPENGQSAPVGNVAPVCEEGTVTLPWPIAPTTPLPFKTVFQRLWEDRARPIWESPYRVTLVPDTDEAEVALVLLHLAHLNQSQEAVERTPDWQLLEGLVVVDTLAEALSAKDKNPQWDLWTTFRSVRERREGVRIVPDLLTGQFVASIEHLLNQTKSPAKRKVLDLLTIFFYNQKQFSVYDLFVGHDIGDHYIGLRNIKPRSENVHDIQKMLDEADATLESELKEHFPVHPLAQIKHDYRNRWIALLPSRVGGGLGVTAGRVFLDAAEKDVVEERIAAMKRENPQLGLFAFFTGPSSPGGITRHG